MHVLAKWNMTGHRLFASELMENIFYLTRSSIWNSKVFSYKKTTNLLSHGCFNRDLSVVTPVWYYISMILLCEETKILTTTWI